MSLPLQNSSAFNTTRARMAHDLDPNKENVPVSRPRPSEAWLNNPSWIGMYHLYLVFMSLTSFVDGAVNPPVFYTSREMIEAALLDAGRPIPADLWKKPAGAPATAFEAAIIEEAPQTSEPVLAAPTCKHLLLFSFPR